MSAHRGNRMNRSSMVRPMQYVLCTMSVVHPLFVTIPVFAPVLRSMSKNNNNKGNKDSNRLSLVGPTNPVDAPIHGTHAGSNADKARPKAT